MKPMRLTPLAFGLLVSLASLASPLLVGCSAAEVGTSDGGAGGTSFDAVYNDVLKPKCAGCHAYGAVGYRAGETETSLDFSSVERAFATLKGKSAGMSGNFGGCNGIAFVVPGDASKSLLVAAVEQATRKAFSSGTCTADAVSPMEAKVAISGANAKQIKDWVNAGAAR